jgi:DNA repair protein RadC
VAGGRSADRAARLAPREDLVELARAAPEELARRGGLPRGAALRLASAFALARRVERRRAVGASLEGPEAVHRLLAPELEGRRREQFLVLLLDGRHRLKRWERVSEGTLTTSLVHPREVFAPAVREGAAAVLVAHNHPSGDPEPSPEDLAVTRRLSEAGRLLGIPLLDHVVLGGGSWTSLRERLGL